MPNLVEHPRQQPVGRQWARDVRNHDRDAVMRADHLAKRRGAEWMAHGVLEGRPLVLQARDEARRDHRHVFRGKIDVEAGPPVLELNAHGVGPTDVGRYTVYGRVSPAGPEFSPAESERPPPSRVLSP